MLKATSPEYSNSNTAVVEMHCFAFLSFLHLYSTDYNNTFFSSPFLSFKCSILLLKSAQADV